ncbi:MAG: pyruvate, water dikinase regulatory protein [Pseudomonadota bacterium]|nr:pyruvate, water dikinase regulatory protein [Pseudomonadota bacterium]MDP1904120.1 pyruvate, water dikinase regulatory protein [Pseudomonadota bacterium]MDP2351193.1 pyruvate, water dikinase regulatory protein [Pseudomonadota bacterium]
MKPTRPVFFVSDHTGITAEIIGKSLLSQFPDEAFAATSLPFVDNLEKANIAAQQVREAWKTSSLKPLVYSTLTDPGARAALGACGALVMDIYGHFLGMMVGEIGYPPAPLRGRFHGMGDQSDYYTRINAVNFALAADDGLSIEKYERADVILVGVSRSGKTPTSLYMAMQYSLNVANYPLTPENFEQPGLPNSLLRFLPKLRGLTLVPERLAQIRSERRPNSPYSSMETCRDELNRAEVMMRDAGVPVVDSTARSVEEIAALIKQSLKTVSLPVA